MYPRSEMHLIFLSRAKLCEAKNSCQNPESEKTSTYGKVKYKSEHYFYPIRVDTAAEYGVFRSRGDTFGFSILENDGDFLEENEKIYWPALSKKIP